jgi:hypothetical protein
MLEEGKREFAGVAYALEAAAERSGSFRHQVRTEIGHFAAFDVVPHTFGGIEVGRITRQPLDLKPVALGPQELRHIAATMSGQVVPDENDRVAVNEAFKLREEGDQAGGVEAVFLAAGKQAGFPAIPTEAQRCGYRSLIPMIATRL